jgi:beta-glucosidase
MGRIPLPPGFHWGVATAATAIEGAAREAGRGESIWDHFCRAGTEAGGDTPELASDAYHRTDEDLALLRQLHVSSYRFSIAWPRIQPEGRGPALRAGLDHYGRLVDGLLEAGIRPLPTLYHWDLPQALERRGGWPERDTAGRFADYTEQVVKALGDRVPDWVLLNEPGVFTASGYGQGTHAPGRSDPDAFLRATHVANLAQALGFAAARAVRGDLRIGSAVSLSLCEPLGDGEADARAAERLHAFTNLWYLDPLLRGEYPEAFPGGLPGARMGIREGDLERLRTPLDFIGMNVYGRSRVRALDSDPLGLFARVQARAADAAPDADADAERLCELALRLTRRFDRPVLEVTAHGCAGDDRPGPDGRIRDEGRIEFLRAALGALARALEAGADLRSYHVWSLLDGFAWSEGLAARFGLVHVDFPTGRRTPKASAGWYARVAAENALET